MFLITIEAVLRPRISEPLPTVSGLTLLDSPNSPDTITAPPLAVTLMVWSPLFLSKTAVESPWSRFLDIWMVVNFILRSWLFFNTPQGLSCSRLTFMCTEQFQGESALGVLHGKVVLCQLSCLRVADGGIKLEWGIPAQRVTMHSESRLVSLAMRWQWDHGGKRHETWSGTGGVPGSLIEPCIQEAQVGTC